MPKPPSRENPAALTGGRVSYPVNLVVHRPASSRGDDLRSPGFFHLDLTQLSVQLAADRSLGRQSPAAQRVLKLALVRAQLRSGQLAQRVRRWFRDERDGETVGHAVRVADLGNLCPPGLYRDYLV